MKPPKCENFSLQPQICLVCVNNCVSVHDYCHGWLNPAFSKLLFYLYHIQSYSLFIWPQLLAWNQTKLVENSAYSSTMHMQYTHYLQATFLTLLRGLEKEGQGAVYPGPGPIVGVQGLVACF